MARSARTVVPIVGSRPARRWGMVVGHLVEIRPDDQALVDYDGNPHGPLPARTVVTLAAAPASGTPVLLAFEGGDDAMPIVVGFPRTSVCDPRPQTGPAAVRTSQDVVIDVRSLLVQAHQRIVLTCGPASITVSADGSITLRGVNLLSRASEGNRIKGAAVRIN